MAVLPSLGWLKHMCWAYNLPQKEAKKEIYFINEIQYEKK